MQLTASLTAVVALTSYRDFSSQLFEVKYQLDHKLFLVFCLYFVPIHFYLIAATIGLVMGGVQSLSRSTYSKLLPETEDHASYFSFYDVLEKLGIVIGTFFFGLIEGMFSIRESVLMLIVFFALGFLLLLRIPKTEALRGE